jgi:hypothetical protein
MAQVNEIYEIPLHEAIWTSTVQQYLENEASGKETILERTIGGEAVRCMITGFTGAKTRHPHPDLRKKVRVQVVEVLKTEQATA